MRRSQRATPARLATTLLPILPSCTLVQHSHNTHWLCSGGEPYAIATLVNEGLTVRLALSVHCPPAWAAAIAYALARLCTTLQVSATPFLQDTKGQLRHGDDAHAYWSFLQRARPLLTAPQPSLLT